MESYLSWAHQITSKIGEFRVNTAFMFAGCHSRNTFLPALVVYFLINWSPFVHRYEKKNMKLHFIHNCEFSVTDSSKALIFVLMKGRRDVIQRMIVKFNLLKFLKCRNTSGKHILDQFQLHTENEIRSQTVRFILTENCKR